MGLTIPFSTAELETAVVALVFLAWTSISGWQVIVTKLKAAKCIVCDRSVAHHEQAQYVRVACHERCHYLAKLMAREP